ncbi:hypothetical protein CVT24_008285 [Panaeolus cyanescens]|uniref:Uncharacterized protein n=1 Tax=Panaeolus cyanescens TaxID=181874 RepID=A0A409YQJ3_9AGAR|nr:hypothetical protein CVT24_008285 [Panaeolus cyanescens]
MTTSPTERDSVVFLDTPESPEDSADANTFQYRSQTFKVVCSESYQATIDAVLEACPKLVKVPRALIGLILETSGPSGSQRQLTDSNWELFYQSKFRNPDTIIVVTILPIPTPAQPSAPYLCVPSMAHSETDSQITSGKLRARNSSDSISVLSDSSNSSRGSTSTTNTRRQRNIASSRSSNAKSQVSSLADAIERKRNIERRIAFRSESTKRSCASHPTLLSARPRLELEKQLSDVKKEIRKAKPTKLSLFLDKLF